MNSNQENIEVLIDEVRLLRKEITKLSKLHFQPELSPEIRKQISCKHDFVLKEHRGLTFGTCVLCGATYIKED